VKRGAIALRSLIGRIAAAVGLEGAFLLVGTMLLAVAGSFIGPAVSLSIVGLVCVFTGLALAIPGRNS